MDPTLRPSRHLTLTGACLAAALAALSAIAATHGLWKIFVIGWVSFGAMLVGAAIGAYVRPSARGIIWAYGLASGAMLTSATLDLVPLGVQLDPELAGVGIAAGLVAGYILDTAGGSARQSGTLDTSTLRLTAHAVTAGVAIGSIYAMLPGIGLLLGLSIISHKGPAGYAAARRLAATGRTPAVLVIPAAGLGIPAMIVSLIQPSLPVSVNAVIVGLSAGIFLHFAFDFLPREEHREHGREDADAYAGARAQPVVWPHGVMSTVLGAAAVAIAWFLVT